MLRKTAARRRNFTPCLSFPIPPAPDCTSDIAVPILPMDVIARKKRMEGKNVLFPIGYDAFGLPTENYAIQHHVHPRVVTEQNIATFRGQLKALGYSFVGNREINTTDPG